MGFFANIFTWWNGASWGTAICSRRHGEEVGRDDAGNVYFRHRKDPARRWVIYNGSNDGSRVPPGWNAWLRGTIDELPDKALPPRRKFEQAAAAQPDRHDGRLPARRARWRQGRPPRRDRRLRGLEARISVTSALPLLPLGAAAARGLRPARARASAGQGQWPVTVDVPRGSARRQPGVTPMAERVAVLGLLNKRNGIVRDLTLKPGQAIRVQGRRSSACAPARRPRRGRMRS